MLLDDPKSVPSKITAGNHAAIFKYGHSLYVELDGYLVERVKAIGPNDIKQIVETLKEYQAQLTSELAKMQKDYPKLYEAAKSIPGVIWGKLGISTGQAIELGVVFLMIEAVILIVRAVEINHHHMNSVKGGVMIQLIFPNPQIQSLVLPRGGFKSQPGKDKITTAAKAIRTRFSF